VEGREDEVITCRTDKYGWWCRWMQMAHYHRGCDITGAESTESVSQVSQSVRILLSTITA